MVVVRAKESHTCLGHHQTNAGASVHRFEHMSESQFIIHAYKYRILEEANKIGGIDCAMTNSPDRLGRRYSALTVCLCFVLSEADNNVLGVYRPINQAVFEKSPGTSGLTCLRI